VLVLRIHDLEAFCQARFAPVDPEKTMREPVKTCRSISFRVGTPSSASTRSRISAAALFVNVTASTCCAATPFDADDPRDAVHEHARFLPLPAPASTSVGRSGAVTASRCASFKGSMMSVTSIGSREASVRLR